MKTQDTIERQPVTSTKQYLGDGVYVDTEDGCLLLTTENGLRITNMIFLEPCVFTALTQYATRLKQQEQTVKTEQSYAESN